MPCSIGKILCEVLCISSIDPYLFREYDIRGKTDGSLSLHAMELLGKAYGTFLLRRGISKKAVVGHDFRSYSSLYYDAFLRGLLSTGCDAIGLGMCLTPMLYYAQYHFNLKGGAMVTASHNPNGWTGVKVADGYSSTLIGGDVQQLYTHIVADDFEEGVGKLEHGSIEDAYFSMVQEKIRLSQRFKVVIECGNGTAGKFAPRLFRALGCEVVELFCDLDASFPHHNPNPESSIAKEALAAKVREVHADVGLSFDGDGDRLGVVDELGNNVWSDRLCILLARHALARHPHGKIVFDVKCTQALPEDILAHGGIPVMWKTGHSYVKRKCREVGAAFGGERSGHFFVLDNYYGYDDALFAAATLLEYLSLEKKPLSVLLASAPSYVITPTMHVHCGDDVKYRVIEKLIQEFKKEYSVIDVNGARVVFDCGWGLVRASSNEPKLVLVFEGKTQQDVDRYKAIFREKLSQYPEVSSCWENE